MLDLAKETQAEKLCCWRTYYRLDGVPSALQQIEEDVLEHVDTSCFALTRIAFDLAHVWLKMPKQIAPICDRIFKAAKHARYRIAYSKQRTVAFRLQYEVNYQWLGEPAAPGAKPSPDLKPSYDYLLAAEGVTETVKRLGFWPYP